MDFGFVEINGVDHIPARIVTALVGVSNATLFLRSRGVSATQTGGKTSPLYVTVGAAIKILADVGFWPENPDLLVPVRGRSAQKAVLIAALSRLAKERPDVLTLRQKPGRKCRWPNGDPANMTDEQLHVEHESLRLLPSVLTQAERRAHQRRRQALLIEIAQRGADAKRKNRGKKSSGVAASGQSVVAANTR